MPRVIQTHPECAQIICINILVVNRDHLAALERRTSGFSLRLNNVEKDIRHNELRIFNVPRVRDTDLYDIVVGNVLSEGMGFEEGALGSQSDREKILKNKSKLSKWTNYRYNSKKKVSITVNYTYEQNEISKERNEVE